MRNINSISRGNATHYQAQLGLPDNSRAIKELVVCNDWDLDNDILSGLRLLTVLLGMYHINLFLYILKGSNKFLYCVH